VNKQSVVIFALVIVIGFITYKIGYKSSDSFELPEVVVLNELEDKQKQQNKVIKGFMALVLIGLVGFFYTKIKDKNDSSIN
jgi:phosphoglycerol transferase MdoB-like AlkP superfamily enzyme